MLSMASLRRVHLGHFLLIGYSFILVPLISSCGVGTPTQTLPTSTLVEPSRQVSETPSSSQLATATTEPQLNGQLLLEYGYGDSTGIWIMSPPFESPKTLFTDDDYIYGQAVWSSCCT